MATISPIFTIIDQGSAHELQKALAQGASVTDLNSEGMTPLQMAASCGKKECVDVLLDAKAPIDQTSSGYKDSPLIRAVIGGHLDVAQLLITKGANVHQVGSYDEVALYKVALFCPTAQSVAMAQLLLKNGAKILPEILEYVVSSRKVELIKTFLEHGANPSHTREDGTTLYTLALRTGSIIIPRLLQQNGADIYQGRDAPLHAARLKGKNELAKLLGQPGIDIDKRDICGSTALLAAILAKDEESAELLLQAGANVNIENRHKDTPLKAAIYLDLQTLAYELIKCGADLNHGDTFGSFNALWIAALKGNVELFRDLLKAGANYTARDKEGFSLLALIKSSRPPHKKKLIELLKAHAKNDFDTMYQYAKQLNEHKRFGHAFHISKEMTIQGVKVLSVGGYPECAAKTLAKMVRAFSKEFTYIDANSANELTQALQFAADQRSHTPNQTLSRIKKGKFTIILTGWQGHATACGLLQEQMLIVNTGPSGKVSPDVASLIGEPAIEPLQIPHYNPEKLDCESVQLLREEQIGLSADRESYAATMYTLLPVKLQLSEKDSDREIVKKCNVQKQTVSNCSWASLEGIIKAYLTIKGQSQAFEPLMVFTQARLFKKYQKINTPLTA